MSDYASMTNEELRRAIAERLGYTVHYRTGQWGEAWYLDQPGGKHYPHPKCLSEAEAWEDTPNWPGSVDAALTLLDGMVYTLWSQPLSYIGDDRWIKEQKYDCMIFSQEEYIKYHHNMKHRIDEGKPARFATIADTLPRAICIEWLTWKDAQG